MNHLRRSVLALVIFVTFFFNIERLDLDEGVSIVDLQTFVYILGFVAIVLTITVRSWRKIPVALSLVFWAVVYLLCKLVIFYQDDRPLLGDFHTYVSLLEIGFICMSVWLSYRVANDLHDFEETVENITFADSGRRQRPLAQATQDVQNELVRSRRYHHPLSVIVIKPDPQSIQVNLHRTVLEVQRAMMGRYVITSLGRVIDNVLRRTDLMLAEFQHDRFVVVCPETDAVHSKELAERIRVVASEHLGVQVNYGIGAFPDEALTFAELVRKAEAGLGSISESDDSSTVALAQDEVSAVLFAKETNE